MSCIEGNMEQVAKGAGSTHMNLIEFSYEWTIFNFSFHGKEKKEYLSSPTFSMGRSGEYKWQLRIYPSGENYDSAEHVSVYLYYESIDKADTKAKFKFSISNEKKEMANVMGCSRLWPFKNKDIPWGYRKFVERKFLLNEANGLLPNDSLTLVCDIIVVESVSTMESIDPLSFRVLKRAMSDDFGDLFLSSKLCDVTLAVCGREFRAHKAILAARSPVFSAMFEHEMKEQQENRVEITDVDEEVLKEMLWFIYTGKTTNLDKMADGLLVVADKYQLEELKRLCEKELGESLSIGNVATRLIIADLYGADRLKALTLNFILTHTKEISETESYNSMVKTHPHLINEAFLISKTVKPSRCVDRSGV